jgi:hypothetical protein
VVPSVVVPAAVVEMLRRELEASRSVSEHLSFLRKLAEEPAPAGLRESLLAHIGEEEAEHQAHLGRLIPALEALAASLDAPLDAPVSAGFTVGALHEKRPWHVG